MRWMSILRRSTRPRAVCASAEASNGGSRVLARATRWQLRQTGIIASLNQLQGTITFAGTITGTTCPTSAANIPALGPDQISARTEKPGSPLRGRPRAVWVCPTNACRTRASRSRYPRRLRTRDPEYRSDDWGTSGVKRVNPGATVAATGSLHRSNLHTTPPHDLFLFLSVALDR